MKYETYVELSKEKVCHVNNLLLIEDMGEMTDDELLKAGANTDDYIPMFAADFEDGSYITVDVCSGNTNYYDDCVWHSADGKHDVILDCSYEIDDIEVEIDGNTYIVNLKCV